MSTKKQDRHQAILELIAKQTIETQSDLVAKINEQGFQVTQATVSRDIDDLKIVKGPKGYVLPLGHMDFGWLQSIQQHVESIHKAGSHMLVLKTQDSAALVVARDLDHESIDGVVGTLAGIDTVFVAMADPTSQEALYQMVQGAL